MRKGQNEFLLVCFVGSWRDVEMYMPDDEKGGGISIW